MNKSRLNKRLNTSNELHNLRLLLKSFHNVVMIYNKKFFDPKLFWRVEYWVAENSLWDNYRALITVIKVCLSKACLTRLISPRRDIQVETVFIMWSSKDISGSNVTPRSLIVSEGTMSLPNKDRRKSGILDLIWRLPNTINFVFSGFNNKWFLKHQLRTLTKSQFISVAVYWQSSRRNEA